jgi:D-alanine-D-alanine ligase
MTHSTTSPTASAEEADPLIAGQPAARPLRVAVLHNVKERAHSSNGHRPPDALAELDTPRNVADYTAALRALGHTVVALEGDLDLPQRLAEQGVEFCFNTCEGFRGDSREAQVPALLEMLGMPYSASKVLALAVTLDKAMTKRVLAYHGVRTPAFQEFRDPRQPLHPALRAGLAGGRGLFVKPNREGTGIGIYGDAVVRREAELRERIAYLLEAYRQTVLVEEYVEGRDVTCGLVGNFRPNGSADDLHLFPISEVDHGAYPPGTEHFYSYRLKVELADRYRYFCPAPIPEAIAAEVRAQTVETFRACGCLDVARVDFRLDADDGWRPTVLEINALPGLAYNSDLTLCAEAEGWTHYQLLQAVFNTAVRRCGLAGPDTQLPEPNFDAAERRVLAPG